MSRDSWEGSQDHSTPSYIIAGLAELGVSAASTAKIYLFPGLSWVAGHTKGWPMPGTKAWFNLDKHRYKQSGHKDTLFLPLKVIML